MTLVMILAGVGVLLFVAFLPLVEYALLASHHSPVLLLAAAVLQVVHLALLWKSTVYLYIFRSLVLPIRLLVMPLAMRVVLMEAIREDSPILYFDLDCIEGGENLDEEQRLLHYFRQSVRRRYKKMKEKYRQHCIALKSSRCETSLNLSQVVPIMWRHQQRCCCDGNVAVEFLKRFLVVSLATHGILDRYYDAEGQLVSVQLSVQQGKVLHWFMYFSTDVQSGIWYHGILNAMVRGLKTTGDSAIHYVNAQNHQTDSKLGAGLQRASLSQDDDDEDVTSSEFLYPWTFLQDTPEEVLDTKLWAGLGAPNVPESENHHHRHRQTRGAYQSIATTSTSCTQAHSDIHQPE